LPHLIESIDEAAGFALIFINFTAPDVVPMRDAYRAGRSSSPHGEPRCGDAPGPCAGRSLLRRFSGYSRPAAVTSAGPLDRVDLKKRRVLVNLP